MSTDTNTDPDLADEETRKQLVDLAAQFYDQFADGTVPSANWS